MAKAKKFSIEGTGMWVRVFEDNRDMDGFNGAYQNCDGAYTLDLIFNEEAKDKFLLSGSAKKPKEIEPGQYKTKFVRKHKGPFAAASGAPKVVWSDGSEYDYEVEGPIGNGSILEIQGEVYPTKMGVNGTRINKVIIKEHVAFVPQDEEDEVPV